jgi:ABC-type cobalamin transport system ATPase subunit
LVLVPAIVILMVLILVRMGWIIHKESRLLILMLFIESGSGSAQVILVSLNEYGNTKLASKLAYMYLFQYLSSVLTITMWSTLALSLYYTD